MTATSAVSNTDIANSAQKTAVAQVGLNKNFDQFLTLLTTQLQNQDPLNPMDSTQFTNQLVAFSGVEQQINTNQKLDSLLAMQNSNANTAGLGYVGMDISYTSAEMNYDGTDPKTIHYTLDSDASTLKVNIYDESGNLVRSMDGGTSASAANTVTWDGKDNDGNAVPAGTYSIGIAAADANGKPISSSTAVNGRVRGIETQNGATMLLVGDRAVPMSSVIQAIQPDPPTTPVTPGTPATPTTTT